MSIVDHPRTVSDPQLQTPGYAPIPAQRRAPKTRKRVLTALGGAVVLALLGLGLWSAGMFDRVLGLGGLDRNIFVVHPMSMSITLTESGELKPLESVNIKCELDGRQNTILYIVEESSKVKKGDLLVEFASDQLREDILSERTNLSRIQSDLEAARQDLSIQISKNQSDIEKADSDVKIAELDLKKYVEGDYKQSRKSVALDIKQAEADIEIRRDELARTKKLKEKKFATETEIRELAFALIRAEASLEKYELAQKILLEYENPRDHMQKQTAFNQAEQEFVRVKEQAESRKKQAEARVKDVDARVELSEAKLVRLRSEFEHCKIFSPADGVVQYAGGEGGHFRDDDRIAAGVSVRKGQTLLYLPDTSQMLVTTRIHEADRHMIRPGLTCIVKVAAVPGATFHGTLTKISQYADSANRWMNPELKEHTAEILLEKTDEPVSPGDSAEITLLIGELEDVLAVPVISVFARGSKSFVFVKKGTKTRPVEIKVGRTDTTMVEVTDGLSEGDRVLRYAEDDLIALLPKAESIVPRGAMPRMKPAAARPDAGINYTGAVRPAGAERMGKGGTRPDGTGQRRRSPGGGRGKPGGGGGGG